MQRYLMKRAVRALLVIWLVSTVVFFALRIVGDPVEIILGAGYASARDVEQHRAFLQLDTPLVVQYGKFLVSAAQGDMGRSFRYRVPALPLILKRLPATLELAAAGMFIGVAIGGTLGVMAAMRPNSWVDQVTVFVALLGQSIPVFWLGVMLIMVFAVRLDWLPATGSGGINHVILPALCLSNLTMASVARLIRSNMMDVMSQDYIRTARAKGLDTTLIVIRHALRNAMLPAVTVIGLHVSVLLGGAVVVETIFDWPGMGSLIFGAVQSRDFPLVQGATIIFGVTVVLANLAVDIIYAYIDPRIRYA